MCCATTTTTTTTPWHYSPCRTLASITTIFQSSLLCARILQFVTPVLLRYSLTLSIHLNLGLPTLLLPSAVFWCNLFTTLSSLTLSTCPSHLAFLFLLLCPILHIIASLHLFCSSNILPHILDQIFFSAPSFPKYANFSHHLPLNTVLLSHTAPLVLLLFCSFLFLLSWIRLLISTGGNTEWKCAVHYLDNISLVTISNSRQQSRGTHSLSTCQDNPCLSWNKSPPVDPNQARWIHSTSSCPI